jgi:2,3-diketo-5-methylthio-1-phosphopentane phosphatase
MRIFCDFDGTISSTDTSNLIFARFAGPAWEAIEARWVAGEIDAVTCMTQQVELIDAPLCEIEALLDRVELRDGFVAFLEWSRNRANPFTIVSDGVDHFIRHILKRHAIDDVTIIANRLVAAGHDRWTLQHPWRQSNCAGGSGVCKCAIVDASYDDRTTIFIGDGRSDFCVATRPDMLFATGRLERFCDERTIPFRSFDSFADIQAVLENLGEARAVRTA